MIYRYLKKEYLLLHGISKKIQECGFCFSWDTLYNCSQPWCSTSPRLCAGGERGPLCEQTSWVAGEAHLLSAGFWGCCGWDQGLCGWGERKTCSTSRVTIVASIAILECLRIKTNRWKEREREREGEKDRNKQTNKQTNKPINQLTSKQANKKQRNKGA